jgi:hypothetical protein
MTSDTERFATEIFPTDYASWRHCIEVKCGVQMTPDYLQARIKVLDDTGHEETRRFEGLYGEAYRRQVLTWFRQAASEV